jgi:DNA-directed RNA polymerase subunit RPC12/RpoP
MAPVNPKKKDADYRCQDCGLVITVKEVTKKTPHGELLCCNRPMQIV